MAAWLFFDFCCGSAFRFFWRRRIGAMADHRHHGEGEHHQRNVAMPSMPRSALVVIEPELVFRGLKTVLDRPPMAFDRHQRFDGCSRWTPGAEEGEITIGDISTDQQTSRPKTMICAVKFFDLEICQFEIYPVHVTTRKSLGLMMRKLSVTESQRSAQFRGTFSRRKPSVASANWAQVA